MRVFRLFSVVILATLGLHANVRLPALISDHMMVQRDLPVKIWGHADAGEEVSVTFADAKATVKADGLGRWIAVLPPMTAGGPFDLTINTTVIKDVLVGEVWVASGQSNMGFTTGRAANGAQEAASANFPQIRLFQVKHKVSDVPLWDVDGSWQSAAPDAVKNFTAVGYFFARNLNEKLRVPIAIIESDWGGTPAEAWTSPMALTADSTLTPILHEWAKAIAAYPDAMAMHEKRVKDWEAKRAAGGKDPAPAPPMGPGHPWTPGGLYNAMIAPLTNYGIRGAIWYQGESNTGLARVYLYERLFETMIQDWRRAWGQGDFPFLFVQLANFAKTGKAADWPELREAQRRSLSLRNTGMAVAIDVGNPDDIHPTNKQDVGLRLSLAARAVAYGEKLVYSGPAFRVAAPSGAAMRVWFEQAGGLRAKDGGELKGFEIAGRDGVYKPASARVENDTVLVAHSQVAEPVSVRYAWADDPACNLVNGDGLPASPFRSR